MTAFTSPFNQAPPTLRGFRKEDPGRPSNKRVGYPERFRRESMALVLTLKMQLGKRRAAPTPARLAKPIQAAAPSQPQTIQRAFETVIEGLLKELNG